MSIPPRADVVEISTPTPVDREADLTLVEFRPLAGGRYQRPFSTSPFKPLHALLLGAIAYVPPSEPHEVNGQPWEIEPRTWQGVPLPGGTIHVVWMCATWPAATLRAERWWYPGERIFDTVEHVQAGASPADYRKAADALEAIVKFSEHLRAASGPTALSREAARDSLLKAAIELASHGLKVQYQTLQDALFIGKSALYDRLTRAEWLIRDVAEHPKVLATRANYRELPGFD